MFVTLRQLIVDIDTHRYTAIGTNPCTHEYDYSTSNVYDTSDLLQLVLYILREISWC